MRCLGHRNCNKKTIMLDQRIIFVKQSRKANDSKNKIWVKHLIRLSYLDFLKISKNQKLNNVVNTVMTYYACVLHIVSKHCSVLHTIVSFSRTYCPYNAFHTKTTINKGASNTPTPHWQNVADMWLCCPL